MAEPGDVLYNTERLIERGAEEEVAYALAGAISDIMHEMKGE